MTKANASKAKPYLAGCARIGPVTKANAPQVKAFLAAANGITEMLPWRLGDSEWHRKRAQDRMSALTHQVAALLADCWEPDEIREVLASAAEAETTARSNRRPSRRKPTEPDAVAQEQCWRTALERANRERGPGCTCW